MLTASEVIDACIARGRKCEPGECEFCDMMRPVREAAAWQDWHDNANAPAVMLEYMTGQLQLCDLANPTAILAWKGRL